MGIGSEADALQCGDDGFAGGVDGAADASIGLAGGDHQRGAIEWPGRGVAGVLERDAFGGAAIVVERGEVGIEDG